MSQENVELLRAVYAEWAKGNFRAGRELLDPEIELYPLQGLPGAASYHGRQDSLAYVERWLESWDEYRILPEEFIEAGDQVVVIYRAVGRGKSSGIELDSRLGHIWTILDGSAVRIEMSAAPPTPSKPPGCRSRRCRRKTWRSRSGFSRNSKRDWCVAIRAPGLIRKPSLPISSGSCPPRLMEGRSGGAARASSNSCAPGPSNSRTGRCGSSAGSMPVRTELLRSRASRQPEKGAGCRSS